MVNKNKRKIKYLVYSLIFTLLNCKNKKNILVRNVKGMIYSKITNKPIQNVKIFGYKYAINNFDTINSRKDGGFVILGWSSTSSDFRRDSRDVSSIFLLKNKNEFKFADSKKIYKGENYYKKDTIDLGIIYFENLKSIDKDSIPK
ncbi:hypothetical protein IV494_14635 [Kaistella sp. G5-32]|uniref:Lipoprotein n=1 Tax=Kaistella gelatinilytica TaxID=2787636 RepID=A0ABS0FFF1_9FLAO|nr:hypothetical protein [Kaistella gelatinilytica]MBF8458417.1 hypothetical protein [Kaistella gelatinilytica]